MAAEETNIVHDILKDVSPSGVRLFKNVRGFFYTLDSVKALISAVVSMNGLSIKVAIQGLRQLAAGLIAAGSSDLIGFTPVVITQEMVGTTIAVFTAIEVKTPTGRVQPEQANFIDYVKKSGGFSGVARCSADARKIVKIAD